MKTAIVALVLLISALTLVVANSLVLGYMIDGLVCEVEGLDTNNPTAAREGLEKLSDRFESRRPFIGLTVNHNDITSIEASISELFGAADAADTKTLAVVKSRLIGELTHLRRLSGINFDSVF